MELDLEVGQRVTVIGYHQELEAVRTVKRIGKTQATLDDGSRWLLRNGCAVGASTWSFRQLREWQPGDEAAVAHRLNIESASLFRKWHALTPDEAKTVADVLVTVRARLKAAEGAR